MILKAIIVDDETLARNLLAAILTDITNIKVVAECKNGLEAIEAVVEHTPDVMFLDIEMPEVDGFAVIRAIQSDILPKIIFTTAYTQYAVDAFRVQALNYVLKPLDEEKILESVERVKKSLQPELKQSDKVEILTALKPAIRLASDQSVIVRDNDKIAFLDKDEIDWIEADGDYVCIHNGSKTHLIRMTLKSVEMELLETNFQRIHRSTIVNLNKISEIVSGQKGEATVIMKGGQCLKVSRSYGAALRTKLL